ncbi:MAG: metallophosphoesterase [Acholeplasmatales bacterium]|jgi:hypothetical protein|nr:metallophosphoesterase [Acholeplasmatales bacterium]
MRLIKKILKITLFVISGIVLTLLVLLLYISIRKDDKEIRKENYEFNSSLSFDLEKYTQTINIENEYQNILVLTDIHLYGIFDNKVYKYVTKMVNEQSPDLIVLDGDQCFTPFNYSAYKNLIKFFDSFEIPWAPVFGNHDNFGKATKDKLSRMLTDSIYCIFQYGPSNLDSAGNYVVNLSYLGNVVHSLILMDSNDKIGFTGNPSITKEQLEWYEWVIKGLQNTVNPNIKTTLFLHVPIPEFNNAYNYGIENGSIIFGGKGEKTCSPKENIGLFDKIKELGSTVSIVSGHDHLNCFSVDYEGVRFSYALHSGYGSYGSKKIMGCLVYKVYGNGDFGEVIIYYAG